MNCQFRALLISCALHLGAIFLTVTFNRSFAKLDKPVVIDFTLGDSKGSPPAIQHETPKAAVREHMRMKDIRKKTAPVERPRVLKTAPIPLASLPSLSTGIQGYLPVSAPASATTDPGSVNGNKMQATGGRGSGPGHGQAIGKGAENSAETMRNRYLSEHFEYIKTLIQSNLSYPARAQRMGWTGKVVVSFTILENGYAVNTRILSSSGYDLLDDNVLDTIKTVEPFPKPPIKAVLKIPITYRLDY